MNGTDVESPKNDDPPAIELTSQAPEDNSSPQTPESAQSASAMLPGTEERIRTLTRRHSDCSDTSDGWGAIEMKIMNLRTGRQREVDFFIDPLEFLSVKTAENVHTYLWILKDLSWTENWYWMGLIVGGLALALSFFVTVGSVYGREYADAWHNFAQLLWLISNFIWMTGDFHDSRFPDSPSVYDQRAAISQDIMIFALAWLGLYYLVLRPLNVFNEKEDPYCRITYKSWVSRLVFKNWSEYERLHIFFWLLKDMGWNSLNKPTWYMGLVPTLTMSIDFAWIVANVNGMIVESAHYIAQFIWVIGNAVWAYGELYYGERDDAYPLFSRSSESRITFRWYSGWVLVGAFVPVLLVYIILIAYSLYGYTTGNLAMYQNPVGSNTLLDIHTLNSSDANGKHMAIRQVENDINSSFTVPQAEDAY